MSQEKTNWHVNHKKSLTRGNVPLMFSATPWEAGDS